MLQDLHRRFDDAASRALFIEGAYAARAQYLESMRENVRSAETSLKNLQECGVILNSLTTASQQVLKDRLEGIVTYALSRVFEREFKFIVEFRQSRANVIVEFKLASEETAWEPVSLQDGRGGGVCEIVGFIMRLVFLMYLKSQQRQIMVLDEPFGWVSAQYVDNLMELIRELALKTGLQFIIVTHNERIAELGDRRYRFSLDHGRTVVQALDGQDA
jgi:DNA repair exonuclease SbcCD ATPase subunit